QLCVEKTSPVPTGTGKAARIPGMVVLGKTGTAQVAALSQTEHYANELDIPKHLRDHAWFMAGVVDREPKLAIFVLIEHGLHGSSAAAPLAKEVIEFFSVHCLPPELDQGTLLAHRESDRWPRCAPPPCSSPITGRFPS